MILPVGAVSTVSPVSSVPAIDPAASLAPVSDLAATAVPQTDGAGFAQSLGSAVEQLQELQTTSQELAVKAVTGDLDDVHDYTVAASEAKLALELTATVRNKAVEAFTEIMRMQA